MQGSISQRLKTLLIQKTLRYKRNEDGTMVLFGVFMFLMMLMIGGIAYDLLRNENVRSHLQNVSDTAALAGANLNNTQDPEVVVLDYFNKAGLAGYLKDVQVTQKVNSRRVTVTADSTTKTTFMHLGGVENLPVYALGTAQQDAGDIEIAMILDVSGSMVGQRETNMETAARSFIDTVLPDTSIPVDERPSISLIPYNDMVNIGQTYGPYFNMSTEHTYSWCARLDDALFDTVIWDDTLEVERLGHYDSRNNTSYTPISNEASTNSVETKCPTDLTNAFLLYETNPTKLKNHITALEADNHYGWTAIALGAKFGTITLDPSGRDITNELVLNGVLDARAANLPKDYVQPSGVPNTKVMVLMTDGTNTLQRDLKQKHKSGNSNVYYAPIYKDYFRNGVSAAYSVYSPHRYNKGQKPWWFPYYGRWYWSNPFDNWSVPYSRLTNPELFNKQTMLHIGHRIFTRNVPEYTDYVSYSEGDPYANGYEDYIGSSDLNDQTEEICDTAKAAGMVIYAVAFEAPKRGKKLMSYCSTSPAHYFEVTGTQVILAFEAIGRNINQLKLTQ